MKIALLLLFVTGLAFAQTTPTINGVPVTIQNVLPYPTTTLDHRNLSYATESSPGAPTIAQSSTTGVVTAGTHSVVVTFVTANGETPYGTASNTITQSDSVHQISVTAIPTGSTYVTARHVCMTVAGGNFYYYVGSVSDNTTTTYSINVSDTTLLANSACNFENTTGGWGALTNFITTPSLGNYFGGESGPTYHSSNLSTANGNTGFGRALWNITTGLNNTGMGLDTLGDITSGYSNVAFGVDSQSWGVTSFQNASIGHNALRFTSFGDDNVGVGFNACASNTAGQYNMCLGSTADFLYPDISSTTFTATNGSANLSEGYYFYKITFLLQMPGGSTTETTMSYGNKTGINTDPSHLEITLAHIPTYSGPLTCVGRKIYRSVASGPSNYSLRSWYLDTTINDNTTTGFVDTVSDSTLVQTPETTTSFPNKSIIMGFNAAALYSNQMIIGSPSAPVKEVWFNPMFGGTYTGVPYNTLISAENGAGTNVAGANLTLQGGPGTGNAGGGSVLFNYCPAGSSGTTLNSSSCVGLGGTGSNGWTFNYTNSGAAVVPVYITNGSSTTGGSVELRLGVTSSVSSNTNGVVGFVNTRQSDGSSNLAINVAPGSAGSPVQVLQFVGATRQTQVYSLAITSATGLAPSTSTVTLPTTVYGAGSVVLTSPTAWCTITQNSVSYKIPCY